MGTETFLTTHYPWLSEGDAARFNNDFVYTPNTEIVPVRHGYRDYAPTADHQRYDQMLIDAVWAMPDHGDTDHYGIYQGGGVFHSEWWRVTRNFGGAQRVNDGRAVYDYYARELQYDEEHLERLQLDEQPGHPPERVFEESLARNGLVEKVKGTIVEAGHANEEFRFEPAELQDYAERVVNRNMLVLQQVDLEPREELIRRWLDTDEFFLLDPAEIETYNLYTTATTPAVPELQGGVIENWVPEQRVQDLLEQWTEFHFQEAEHDVLQGLTDEMVNQFNTNQWEAVLTDAERGRAWNLVGTVDALDRIHQIREPGIGLGQETGFGQDRIGLAFDQMLDQQLGENEYTAIQRTAEQRLEWVANAANQERLTRLGFTEADLANYRLLDTIVAHRGVQQNQTTLRQFETDMRADGENIDINLVERTEEDAEAMYRQFFARMRANEQQLAEEIPVGTLDELPGGEVPVEWEVGALDDLPGGEVPRPEAQTWPERQAAERLLMTEEDIAEMATVENVTREMVEDLKYDFIDLVLQNPNIEITEAVRLAVPNTPPGHLANMVNNPHYQRVLRDAKFEANLLRGNVPTTALPARGPVEAPIDVPLALPETIAELPTLEAGVGTLALDVVADAEAGAARVAATDAIAVGMEEVVAREIAMAMTLDVGVVAALVNPGAGGTFEDPDVKYRREEAYRLREEDYYRFTGTFEPLIESRAPVYVYFGGFWHAATVNRIVHRGAAGFETNVVEATLTDFDQTFAVPEAAIQVDRPDFVATWEPYYDPTREFHFPVEDANTHIEVGEQMRVPENNRDGYVWKTVTGITTEGDLYRFEFDDGRDAYFHEGQAVIGRMAEPPDEHAHPAMEHPNDPQPTTEPTHDPVPYARTAPITYFDQHGNEIPGQTQDVPDTTQDATPHLTGGPTQALDAIQLRGIWYDGHGNVIPDPTQNVTPETVPRGFPTKGTTALQPVDTTRTRVPQITQRADTQQRPMRAGFTPDVPDPENVVSYMHREHNEITTIWRNPNTPGYDNTRFDRLFNGVVPFLAYNAHGQPILYNDTELNHHGHTDYNMVRTQQGGVAAQYDFTQANLLTPQTTGQVDTTNAAQITETVPAAQTAPTPTPTQNVTVGNVGK